MDEVTSQEIAQIIADALKAKGIQVAGVDRGQSASRFARLSIALDNGQEFTVQLEEK